MKKLMSLLLALGATSTIYAQIQLRQLNGTQTRKIGLSTEITLRLNTPSSRQTQDAYHDYQGSLLAIQGDSIEMSAQLETRYYADEQGLYKRVSIDYCCPPGQDAVFVVPVSQVVSIQKGNPNITRGIGGLVLMGAILHSVAIAPFLNAEARRNSDILVAGGTLVGLGLVILPRPKTYHLAASKKENVKRWRIVGQ